MTAEGVKELLDVTLAHVGRSRDVKTEISESGAVIIRGADAVEITAQEIAANDTTATLCALLSARIDDATRHAG